MGKINERTLQAMKYYKEHWQEPDCVPEMVAKKFKLKSSRTIRNHLQEIVDELTQELGYTVTRKELLERPHAEHLCYERKYEPVEPINLERFRFYYNETKKAMNKTIEGIDEILAAQDVKSADDEKGDL